VYTYNSKHRRAVNAGQVYRFVREMREGDYVLTYIKSSRELLIGRVTGGHAHKPDALDGTYDQIRPVAFGCEQPLIKAQVKHKQSTSGGPEMRSFIGTLRSGRRAFSSLPAASLNAVAGKMRTSRYSNCPQLNRPINGL